MKTDRIESPNVCVLNQFKFAHDVGSSGLNLYLQSVELTEMLTFPQDTKCLY
jgi:hypothetical protein